MLSAVMLPVFIGTMALSIDAGVIALARSQLMTAADASALAAAARLASDRRLQGVTDLSPEMTAGDSAAIAFGAANSVIGKSTVIVGGDSGDITYGYMDPNNPAADLATSGWNANLFNSARVTASRNENRGGVIPTFFSGIFGSQGSKATAQSIATAQLYEISGFRDVDGQGAGMLPIVLDVNTYGQMMLGNTSDQYSWNESTKTVTSGADGVKESKLYPVASGSPGNWGTINVGVSNNSTSTLGSQIRDGITPAQLATFPGGEIKLNSSLSPPSYTFGGNPGISAGIKDDLISIIGKPVTIPIYDLNGGNGNNAWYRVIKFAGVRIVAVNFQGNPKYVIVQPAIVTDPNAQTGAPQTSWTEGGKLVLHLTR